MRTHSRSAIMITLALVAAAATGQAQFAPGHDAESSHLIRVGLGGGVEVPTSNARAVFQNGVHGQGFVLIKLGPLPSIRLNLGYTKFNFKNALTGTPENETPTSGVSGGSSRILAGVAGMKLDLIRGPVRPYLLAGVGAFNIKSTVTPSSGSSASTSTSESQTKFGVDGGAGIALKLGRVDAFVEGRVQNIYTNQGMISTKSIRSIPVTFGILF